MDTKEIIFKELVKNGHAKSDGKRCWNIANRSFLNLTPELSKGFLNLIESEVYKKGIFDNEVKLIKDSTKKFIEKIGTDEPFNLIDIGCGNGMKAKEFIKTIKGKPKIRYCPISPSKYIIDLAIKNIKEGKFNNVIAYEPYMTDYEELGKVAPIMRSNEFKKNIILLHGSIIASYEINDYLFDLSKHMFDGDYIIIGNGIRKGERFVGIEKYKIKEFDNWFMLLLKEIGFNREDVEYDAEFRNNRMEAFYRIKADKTIKHKNKEIKFRKGDEVLVFKLYKYYLEELEKFFGMYFSEIEIVKGLDTEYILALCKK